MGERSAEGRTSLGQAELTNSDTVDDPLDRFRAIVGSNNVLCEPSDMATYLTDWTGQYESTALAVVRPSSTEQVSRIVKECAEMGLSIVPQGGRTGLCGGGVPTGERPSIVLSLARMNAIRSIDQTARTVTVEAGTVLETLHNAALEHDLIFPLMFGAKGSCSIGGNLSTNAGGSNVVHYGNTRELCLGIEAVMPDGSIVNALTGLRKDNTGYDLKNLLIGAEGTLGIITAAVFKLFKQPVTRVAAFLSVSSLEAATEVLNRLQDRTGGAVEAFEYMPKHAVNVICEQFGAIRAPLSNPAETGILVEVASSRELDAEETADGGTRLTDDVMMLLSDLMESGMVLDAMVAQSEQQRADLWHMRESILEAITKNGPAYHLDISLPLSNVAAFVVEMDRTVADLGFTPVTVGHLGDGNLHYALTASSGHDWAGLSLEAAKRKAFDLLTKLNGSFSAEHGIGQSKLDVMRRLKQPSQLGAMRSIKQALDPQNIMNPGKLIPSI